MSWRAVPTGGPRRVQSPGSFPEDLRNTIDCKTITLGIDQGGTRPIAISLPAGTILQVPDGFVNATGLVQVEWARRASMHSPLICCDRAALTP